MLQELLDLLKDLPGSPAEPKALPGKKIKQSKTRPNASLNPLKQDRSLAPATQPKEG